MGPGPAYSYLAPDSLRALDSHRSRHGVPSSVRGGAHRLQPCTRQNQRGRRSSVCLLWCVCSLHRRDFRSDKVSTTSPAWSSCSCRQLRSCCRGREEATALRREGPPQWYLKNTKRSTTYRRRRGALHVPTNKRRNAKCADATIGDSSGYRTTVLVLVSRTWASSAKEATGRPISFRLYAAKILKKVRSIGT